MNEFNRHIQEEVPSCMMFIDDIVLVDENRKEIASKLEKSKEFLKSKGFRSRTKNICNATLIVL